MTFKNVCISKVSALTSNFYFSSQFAPEIDSSSSNEESEKDPVDSTLKRGRICTEVNQSEF